jgi:hypothetical protein
MFRPRGLIIGAAIITTVFFGPLDAPKIPQMTRNQGVHPKVVRFFYGRGQIQ